MKFSQEKNDGTYLISAYDNHSVTMAGKQLTHSFILSRETVDTSWNIVDILQLNAQLLTPILKLQPELIIIGTGKTLVFPKPETYVSLIEKQIAIDFMSTAAACRTFNILASEARDVVAGFII